MTTTHTLPIARTGEPLRLAVPAPPRPGPGPGAATARSLARRLALALHDLGLAGVVPAGWACASDGGLRFGDLDVAGANRLVRHLEDLAASLPPVDPPATGSSPSPAAPSPA